MKWLPLIGGNVSFAATYSALAFILMELFTFANRLLDKNSLLPGEHIPTRCQTVVIEPKPKSNIRQNFLTKVLVQNPLRIKPISDIFIFYSFFN